MATRLLHLEPHPVLVVVGSSVQERIEHDRRERRARLAARAVADGMQFIEEAPDQFVVWKEDRLGICDLVTPGACTCYRFRVFGACMHHALVWQ